MQRLREHVAAENQPGDGVIVMGDFNIAPDDRDVWDPKVYDGGTHVSQPERDSLAALEQWGMVDVFREQHAEPGIYSWWDYRNGDFHKGRGMRIDLVLATRSVADRCRFAVVDRNARKGQQPSDHAPVVVDIDD